MSELSPRESALKKINDALSAAKAGAEERAQRAEARATELQQRLADASAQVTGQQAEIERLQRQLAAKPAPAPAAPGEKKSLFGRRKPEPVAPPPAPESVAEVAPEPVAPAPLPEFTSRPTLTQLEAVAEQLPGPQGDEWRVYVSLLRDHTSVDGTIPPQFDDILQDVFRAPI